MTRMTWTYPAIMLAAVATGVLLSRGRQAALGLSRGERFGIALGASARCSYASTYRGLMCSAASRSLSAASRSVYLCNRRGRHLPPSRPSSPMATSVRLAGSGTVPSDPGPEAGAGSSSPGTAAPSVSVLATRSY